MCFLFFLFLFPEQKNLLLIWWSHSFPLLEDDRDKVLGSCCCSSRMYRNKKKKEKKRAECVAFERNMGPPIFIGRLPKQNDPARERGCLFHVNPSLCVCVSVCLCVCVCNVVSCRLLLPRLALPFYLFLFSIKDQNQSIKSHRFSRRSRHSCDFCTLTFLLF